VLLHGRASRFLGIAAGAAIWAALNLALVHHANCNRKKMRIDHKVILIGVCFGLFFGSCKKYEQVWELPRPNLADRSPLLSKAIAQTEAEIRNPRAAVAARFSLGQIYQANRYDNEARSCYTGLIDSREFGAKACYLLALTSESSSDLDGEINWLMETLRRRPDYVPAELYLAKALEKRGDRRRANELYAMILQQDRENPFALLAVAQERMRTGQTSEAAALLEELTTQHPEFSAGWALFAQFSERNGESKKADSLNIKARAHKDPPPPDPWAEEMMKNCYDEERLEMKLEDYIKAGKQTEALDWLRRLEEVNPNNWLVCQIRAVDFVQKGQLDDALRQYQRALSAGGDPDKVLPALVGLMIEMGRFPEAEHMAAERLKLSPYNYRLMVQIAQVRLRSHDIAQALVMLKRALEISPRDAAANRILAQIYWEQNERGKALPLLQLVREVDPRDLTTRALLGQYFIEKGQPELAIPPLEEAVMIDSKNEGISELLGLAYLRLGNALVRDHKLKEAISSYDQAIAIRPGQTDAYANKAQALAGMGRFLEAEQTLRPLLESNTKSPEAFLTLGNIQHAMGEESKARSSWQNALQLLRGAENPALRKALERHLAESRSSNEP
jgi:tetratricopeptide (TPR) repeat protein